MRITGSLGAFAAFGASGARGGLGGCGSRLPSMVSVMRHENGGISCSRLARITSSSDSTAKRRQLMPTSQLA